MNSKFQHSQENEGEHNLASESKTQVEFASPEEALRFDAEQNPPPPEIAERLNQSLANEPKPAPSFWEKLGFRKP
jgi:hypothetical protein